MWHRKEIGFRHGTAFKSRIDASLRLYKPRFAGNDDWLTEKASTVCDHLQERTPKLLEELKGRKILDLLSFAGIAAGSENPLHDIIALNARTEFIRPLKTPDEIEFGECTTVCFPSHGVLGESWDWYKALQELTVVLDITQGMFGLLYGLLRRRSSHFNFNGAWCCWKNWTKQCRIRYLVGLFRSLFFQV